ncbi:SLBB domain-containing protein [Arcicella rosea]|uniref:Protein involved in polysaccharide export with SLBB domain n=1 Tax=Arcicella rosea TaxID=502909 RepID=A0A841F067_9BACT|nr:SLBB domain-containing protein [Arcicella rosea]MBB6005141.1 protein involved in polysaccharide export with SLBB domain [Arcicella rosea]
MSLQTKYCGKYYSYIWYIFFFSFFFCAKIQAQKKLNDFSDEQLKALFLKAQANGMSESQIKEAMLLKGYSSAQFDTLQERFTKKYFNNLQPNSPKEIISARQVIKPAIPFVKKDSFEHHSPKSAIFGASLFTQNNLSFEPDLRIATPKNYQLGPDDELNIDIFGNALDNYKVKISPEGTIKILNLAPIYINGLSIETASERIIKHLRQLYQGINLPQSGVSAQITLSNVRSIKVTLTGEVHRPGTYTISSLASVFNALYLSGGPSENGSFRNIRVIRNNKIVRIIDLYDFLLRADQKDNIRLQDQDIIRIADYETRVEIIGEVKRPMIFEVKSTENLKEILRFAGGFTDKAYTNLISLKRNTATGLKLFNITEDEVLTFIPKNGDKYTVGAILERYENRVQIKGAVFRAGEYALERGLSTVKELIKKAEGLKEEAFLNRATITRKQENNEPIIMAFDVGKLIRNEISDIPLQREDIVEISSIPSLREKRTVSIYGEVNKTGVFDFVEGLTIEDLILFANGFTDAASNTEIELSRRILDDDSTNTNHEQVKIFTFKIDRNLKLSSENSGFRLQAFDRIYVRKSPNYAVQKSVRINGEVNFSGVYTIKDKTQRITDLIHLAGGLKKEAFPKGAKFMRDSSVLAIDLAYILQNPNSSDNLLLLNGDYLEIPRTLETVKLSGEFLNPVAVTFRQHLNVKDYIRQAGGFTDKANKRKLYIKYANGISDKTRKFLIFYTYPKVEQGAEIIVPSKQNENIHKLSTGERIALVGAITSVSYLLVNISNNLK